MVDEQQVLDAVVALLDPALPKPVLEHGAVGDPAPPEYLTVYVVRRAGGSPRAGRYVTGGWAVYLTGASSRSGENARDSLERARTALENKTLTVGSERSTPMRFDNARPITDDKGWHAGVSVYHFAI